MLLKYIKKKKKSDRGITLTEMLLVVIVVGILAAITVPSLIGLFNQNQVTGGFAQLRGAIKEAQRQAQRRGRQCKIRINTTKQTVDVSPPDANGDYTGCLLNTRKLPDGVLIETNYRSSKINFSAKGNTSSAGTIVVHNPNTQSQKCIVISLGLGIMRSGNYTGDVSNSVTAKHCQTTGS